MNPRQNQYCSEVIALLTSPRANAELHDIYKGPGVYSENFLSLFKELYEFVEYSTRIDASLRIFVAAVEVKTSLKKIIHEKFTI